MKVLITGASGFIGGKLLNTAIKIWGSHNIVAFSSQKISGGQSIVYNLNALNLGLSAVDIALLETIDIIFHVGAFIPKNSKEANIIKNCNENILFTEKLLKLPFNKLRKIIFTSTIDVYADMVPISEITPTQPKTLYSWSKLYCEQIITAFAAQRNIVHQILRVGHVYGPGEEKFSKFLPKTIKNIINNETVELYGDGSELRSFIYIDDVIKTMIASADLKEDVGVINIASAHMVSIKELLNQLIFLSNKPVEVIEKNFNSIKRDYIFNTQKLQKYLLPVETNFASGLRTEYTYFENLNLK